MTTTRVTSSNAPEHLFWLDIETTGLNRAFHDIVEIAAVVTTPDLDEVATFARVVKPWVGWENRINDFVLDMHTRTGLLTEIPDGTPDPEVARQLAEFAGDHKGAYLAGSGVHFDRAFIEHKWRPSPLAPLHYRHFDVSTLRTFVKLYAPDAVYEQKNTHRAMDDVQDAIAELRHYRAMLTNFHPLDVT